MKKDLLQKVFDIYTQHARHLHPANLGNLQTVVLSVYPVPPTKCLKGMSQNEFEE